MKKKTLEKLPQISCVVAIACLLSVFISVNSSSDYKKCVTENVLSLVAMVIKDASYEEKRVELTKNLLTFADLSDECKQGILNSIENKSDKLEEIVQKLEFFEYSKKEIKNLESLLEESRTQQVIKIMDRITSEELAKKLVKDVYSGVSFEKYDGGGNGYITRYFCSNICIDACEDGTLRYLCDVAANSSEDLFLNWLTESENIKVIEEMNQNGMIYKKVDGNNIKGTLCINPENSRVIAAEITIKYDD